MSTNYYYLLFTTIRSDLMRKRRIFEENLKKNDDWKKNKLFAWSDYQNYFDDQNWLLIYIRNSDDKLDSIILQFSSPINQLTIRNTTPKYLLSTKTEARKWHLKTKQKKTKLYDTASYCVWVYLVIFVNKSCFQKTRSLWFIRINLLKL